VHICTPFSRVHVIPELEGTRVEVQVRTERQNRWDQIVERPADKWAGKSATAETQPISRCQHGWSRQQRNQPVHRIGSSSRRAFTDCCMPRVRSTDRSIGAYFTAD